MCSREFGLTYPQCTATREEVATYFKHRLSPSYILVAQEAHQDGGLHLHCLLQFSKKKDILNTRAFDYLTFHPNIQLIRDSDDWKKYCIKEDKTPYEFGVFESIKKMAKKKLKITNKELLEEDPRKLILDEKLSIFALPTLMHAKKIYADLAGDLRPNVGVGDFVSNWDIPLELKEKTIKKRHFWLWSSMPDKGKTYFLSMIFSRYRSYYYNQKSVFQDLVTGIEFILFDEYCKGNSLKITDLNLICDGSYSFPRKNMSSIVLDKPWVIVTSNFPISEVYPNSNSRIEARFMEICLDLAAIS